MAKYNYEWVKCPDFVTRDDQDNITEIKCKVCGTVIMGRIERHKERPDGTKYIIEQLGPYYNYTEIKIGMQDGSAHVTNGCDKCLRKDLPADRLIELMLADAEDQKNWSNWDIWRTATGVHVVKKGAGGIE